MILGRLPIISFYKIQEWAGRTTFESVRISPLCSFKRNTKVQLRLHLNIHLSKYKQCYGLLEKNFCIWACMSSLQAKWVTGQKMWRWWISVWSIISLTWYQHRQKTYTHYWQPPNTHIHTLSLQAFSLQSTITHCSSGTILLWQLHDRLIWWYAAF